MPTIKKPIGDIEAADLHALVSDGWPESELLELKETLASNSSGVADRWLTDQAEIGQSAKRDLLAEVVAMANSYGGDVILGVAESDKKPPRATTLVNLPKCVELAHRLELAARDLIKPEIPMLAVRGVPLSGDAGLVILRVPRSRSAPHRLEMKGLVKECYKRVSDRTEPMTMREIQDLTFSVARGLEAVDARFRGLHADFVAWSTLPQPSTSWRRRGFRVSAVPLSADLLVERVHGREELRPISRAFNVKLGGRLLTFQPIGDPYNWRPVLRGTQATEQQSDRGRLLRLSSDGSFTDQTYLDASIGDTVGQRTDHVLYPGWLFGTVLCAFHTVDQFRREAAANGVEYGVEIEIGATTPLTVMKVGESGSWIEPAGTIPAGLHLFPRYVLSDREIWEDTLNLMWRDFWSFIGIDAHQDRVELP